MKQVVLSADGARKVYAVPDTAAEHLEQYCLEFCDWLAKSPDAAQYRAGQMLCYSEADFISYLNRWRFPEEASFLIENLGWIDFGAPLPEPYQSCPQFNF